MRAVANGVWTRYEVDGEGEAVTLVHALGLGADAWWRQVPPLADAYRVLTYDIRGHGQSDQPDGPYTLDQMVADLRALLQALEIERTHLVGLSLGGMIAQLFALSHPTVVRSLVLCDTSSGFGPEGGQVFLKRASLVEREGIQAVVGGTLERWFTDAYREMKPQPVARVEGMLRAANPRGYAAACRAIASVDLTRHLGALRVPTMVVVGDEDISTTPEMARTIAQAIPGAQLEIVPRAAHLVPVEKAEVFNALLHEFLPQT